MSKFSLTDSSSPQNGGGGVFYPVGFLTIYALLRKVIPLSGVIGVVILHDYGTFDWSFTL